MTPPDWKTRCIERKQKQKAEIPRDWFIELPPPEKRNVLDVPKSCGLLTDRELLITETVDIDYLLRKLASSEWSSVEVTTAFYKRAIVAQQLTNCLTEIFVEKTLARAKEVDDHLQNTGKVMGPLHGLPISIKDQFAMKGLETIMGYTSWIGNVSEHDAVLIEILYDAGAVPFVRTNVPQTLYWAETFNHVFGRTTNPHNTSLTSGGSSGGEGALLALKGSPLGVGTDIGGSVRIPSHFCGLYSLRPSYERFPYCGAFNTQDGQTSIPSVLGPMANSLSAVRAFTKAILDAKPWNRDPLVVRKPWCERGYGLEDHGGRGARLCFAIMWDNSVIKPLPPTVRAMKITKAALEAAGHKVIDWIPHRHLEIYKNAETIFCSDGYEDFRTECAKSGEPFITTMRPDHEDDESPQDDGLPRVSPFVWTLVGQPRSHTAFELWQLVKEKKALRKSHLDYWQATIEQTGTGRPIDAIISPVTAFPACPHGLNTDAFYTTLVNAMDYSAACFPVTVVDPELDVPVEAHDFYNHEDEAFHQLYKPELFENAPVGLQLIGRTQEEEAVIAMTEVVDNSLNQYSKT